MSIHTLKVNRPLTDADNIRFLKARKPGERIYVYLEPGPLNRTYLCPPRRRESFKVELVPFGPTWDATNDNEENLS